MTTAAREVLIQPLEIGDRVIIPGFYLGTEIANWDKLAIEIYKGAPTLAQLHHGYETNEAIRQNVHANRHKGEFTATFLKDGKESIERPERVYFDDTYKIWIAEGGKVNKVEPPPGGWILEYDKQTGFPSRTSKNRKDAANIFGDDEASYFSYNKDGLYSVRRDFGLFGEHGPFGVGASWRPGDLYSYVGSRSVQDPFLQVSKGL